MANLVDPYLKQRWNKQSQDQSEGEEVPSLLNSFQEVGNFIYTEMEYTEMEKMKNPMREKSESTTEINTIETNATGSAKSEIDQASEEVATITLREILTEKVLISTCILCLFVLPSLAYTSLLPLVRCVHIYPTHTGIL